MRELRDAEVALDEVPEIRPVLHGERLVHAPVLVVRRHRLGVGGGDGPERREGRVAGHELRQDERDERDSDRQDHQGDEAPPEEPEEGPGRPRPRAPRLRPCCAISCQPPARRAARSRPARRS